LYPIYYSLPNPFQFNQFIIKMLSAIGVKLSKSIASPSVDLRFSEYYHVVKPTAYFPYLRKLNLFGQRILLASNSELKIDIYPHRIYLLLLSENDC